MKAGIYKTRKPENEKILDYKPNSVERQELQKELVRLKSQEIQIPLIIGGKEIITDNTEKCVMPHNHKHVLANYSIAGEKELQLAIEESLKAKKQWENMPWEHRASIFLKAANLLSKKYRYLINAATMLCQSKTAYQAEIDSSCELIDFLRFNTYFAQKIYSEQLNSTEDAWNRIEYRPLEGFVIAISPFNFTAIGGNLTIAPTILGNVVNWKPASASVYSNYFLFKILQEAGLPDGVINFIPCKSKDLNKVMINHKKLSGIHFTGSTDTFSKIWMSIAENLRNYESYPRLVGETGGKDFIFAHSSADIDHLVASMIRGSFEYQGQKCSASSRAYIPESIWPQVKSGLLERINEVKIGDVEDPSNYMGAVIDNKSYCNIIKYIEYVKNSQDANIIYGGHYDDSVGYFINPTIIVTKNPKYKTLEQEIFGPILTIYIYKDDELDETLDLCDKTSPYALTGAVFAKDRNIIKEMEEKLCYSAGNFYINDKPTGAVVSQQPFGGSRASGTNDKAGSKLNLYRWLNPRVIKDNFNYNTDI